MTSALHHHASRMTPLTFHAGMSDPGDDRIEGEEKEEAPTHWKFVQSFDNDEASEGIGLVKELDYCARLGVLLGRPIWGMNPTAEPRLPYMTIPCSICVQRVGSCWVVPARPVWPGCERRCREHRDSCCLLLVVFCTSDELVTAVQFDTTGQFLAVGDKSGMIFLFEGHVRKVRSPSNVTSP